MKKGQALWELVLLLLVVAGIGVGVVFYVLHQEIKKPSQENSFSGQSQQTQKTSTTTINYYSLLDILPWSWQGCVTSRVPKGEINVTSNRESIH